MNNLIALGLCLLFFLGAYKVKRTYYALIFLYPFLPHYIGFGIGSEGFALSLNRVFISILFLASIVFLLQNRRVTVKIANEICRRNQGLILMMCILFLIKILSVSVNTPALYKYALIFNDFLYTMGLFFLTVLFITSENDIGQLVKVMFLSYTTVLFLVIIEVFVHKPLLSFLASGEILLLRDISEGFERGGVYRAIGEFKNPVVLGEFLVVLSPIVISYVFRSGFPKFVKVVYLILVTFAIYSTGARAAFVLSIVLLYIWLLYNLYIRSSHGLRIFLRFINVFLIFCGTVLSYSMINKIISSFSGNYSDYIASEGSLISRALQFIYVPSKVIESPFLGFGRQRNFTFLFDGALALDSYYFIVILEIGVVGLLAYLVFYYYAIKLMPEVFAAKNRRFYSVPVIMSIFAIMIYQVFVAIPTVNAYLYIFIGLMAVMKSWTYTGKARR